MRRIFIIIAIVIILTPALAAAADFSVKFPNFPNLPEPGSTGDDIALFIKNLFTYAIGLAGLLAVAVIAVGAILWALSGGSPDKQQEAKSLITSALWGILLLFGSYIILNTINPRLTALEEPTVTKLKDCEKLTEAEKQAKTACLSKGYKYEDTLIPGETPVPVVNTTTLAQVKNNAARLYCLGIQPTIQHPAAFYEDDKKSIFDTCVVMIDGVIERWCPDKTLCSSLVTLDSRLNMKADQCHWWREPSNCKVNPKTNDALLKLNAFYPAADPSYNRWRWTITEAFPPTAPHLSLEHYNGCAVDVRYDLLAIQKCKGLQEFADKASEAGFDVYNEYKKTCPNLKCSSGNTCNGKEVDHEHIHLKTRNCP